MAPMRSTKLLVSLLPFTLCASSTIGGDGTCKNGGTCGNAAVKQEEVNALFQRKSAQVATALDKSSVRPMVDTAKVGDNQVKVTPTGDPNKVADKIEKIEVPVQPRMRKVLEISKTVDDIQALAAAGATPEVATIIADLIRIIEEDLLPKVKEDHEFARSKVTEQIGELTATTESAVKEKTHADSADVSLDHCITDEKRLITEYETCKSEEAALLIERDSAEYCGHDIFDFVGYTGSPHSELPDIWKVDFKLGEEAVLAQLDGYMADLLAWLSATKVKAVADTATWETYDERCKAKTKEYEDKIIECGEREGKWRAKHEECLHVANAQKTALCQFGHAYQAKCASKSDYDQVHTDITGSGTPYSQPDRKQEHRQLARLTCVLDIFKTTTELTTGSVTSCTLSDDEADNNFEAALGSIDLQEETYDSLTSQAKFACAEGSIKFASGVQWTVPANNGNDDWIPKSSEYEKEEGYVYAIASDSSSPPFDFCLDKGSHETAPECGSDVDCSTVSGKRKDPHTKCYTVGGCSSADCCVDAFKEGIAPDPNYIKPSETCSAAAEANLSPGESDSITFRCNGGACLPLRARCNNVKNCGDGSDEELCGATR